MTIKIPLPNDGYAIFKESSELSNRDVKTLRRAARKVGMTGQKLTELGMDELREEQEANKDNEDADTTAVNRKALEIFSHLTDEEDDSLDLFQRTAVVVRLTEWSLERPLPTDPDEIDDLPRPIYATLTTEAAKLDLNEDFSIEGAGDATSPTESSDS